MTTLDAISYVAIATNLAGVVWAVRETLVRYRLEVELEKLRAPLRTRSVISVDLEDMAWFSTIDQLTEPKR